MKKLSGFIVFYVMVVAVFLLMAAGDVKAQTVVETQISNIISRQLLGSNERIEKLQTLVGEYTKTGITEIDEFLDAVKGAAEYAIDNHKQLDSLYYREIGETEDGVTDVYEHKPTLDDWISLSISIGGESIEIAKAEKTLETADNVVKELTRNASDLAKSASDVKNPMKAAQVAKAAKAATEEATSAAAAVKNGGEALVILSEESAAQVKAVQSIIETKRSDKNL